MLTIDTARRLRLDAQRLSDATRQHRTMARLVYDLVGLQAQELTAATLAVQVRSLGLTRADVGRACLIERTVVRTRVMRGTLHLVAAEDAGWLVAVLGPVFSAGYRRRRAELGLDDATTVRGTAALRSVIAERAPWCARPGAG